MNCEVLGGEVNGRRKQNNCGIIWRFDPRERKSTSLRWLLTEIEEGRKCRRSKRSSSSLPHGREV